MASHQASDSEIVQRVRNGDSDAYRVLVNRYAPMIFHVLRRYCRTEEDVEDLAQDTFVRAYENLSSFREEAQFSSWLYRIASNRGKDFAKSARQRRKDDSAADHLDRRRAAAGDPHRDLEASERSLALQEAIDNLAPDYATAFMLKYQMGLPYREISLLTETSISALKVRVHRARKQVRSYLQDKL